MDEILMETKSPFLGPFVSIISGVCRAAVGELRWGEIPSDEWLDPPTRRRRAAWASSPPPTCNPAAWALYRRSRGRGAWRSRAFIRCSAPVR